MIHVLLAWLIGLMQAAAPAPKQAVIETTAGTFVIDLDTTAAPLTTAAIAARRVSAEGQEGLRAFLHKRPPAWAAVDTEDTKATKDTKAATEKR